MEYGSDIDVIISTGGTGLTKEMFPWRLTLRSMKKK